MKLPKKLCEWAAARARFALSDAQVQMARELGLNPRRLGKLANQDQEPWKPPLTEFIAYLYHKRFGRWEPESVVSLEARARDQMQKRAARKARRLREGEDSTLPSVNA